MFSFGVCLGKRFYIKNSFNYIDFQAGAFPGIIGTGFGIIFNKNGIGIRSKFWAGVFGHLTYDILAWYENNNPQWSSKISRNFGAILVLPKPYGVKVNALRGIGLTAGI